MAGALMAEERSRPVISKTLRGPHCCKQDAISNRQPTIAPVADLL